jgi:hypothetical protein
MHPIEAASQWENARERREKVVAIAPYRKSRERRQMSEASSISRAEFENAIAVADAEWREDRIRRAEVEAFVDSLTVSERTRQALLEALL